MKDNNQEQYFVENPTTEEEIFKFDWDLLGKKFIFNTSNSVFSKTAVDFGSATMIETFFEKEKGFEGDILDLGCGYGPVGIILASVLKKVDITMIDINERAVKLAILNSKENKVENRIDAFQSDGFEKLTKKYDRILTNPPIRAGKEVVYSFYDGAFEHLKCNGKLYVVIQKKQGAKSSIDKLTSLFGNCDILNKKSGYFILCCEKN